MAFKRYRKLIVYLLTVDKAKFRKPVYPGDVLKHVEKQNVKNIWKFICKSHVIQACCRGRNFCLN